MKIKFLICLALVGGIVLGSLLGRLPAVHAEGGFLTFTRYHITGAARIPVTGRVVGVSCTSVKEDDTVCFVAVQ